VLAFVFPVVFVPTPVLAHTGNTSAHWEVGQGVPMQGGLQPRPLADPKIKRTHDVPTNQDYIEWDVAINPCDPAYGANTTVSWRIFRLDANGARMGSAAGAGTALSVGSGECPEGVFHQSYGFAPVNGATAWELEFHNGSTVYGIARTSDQWTVGVPTNLQVLEMGKGGQVLDYDQVAALAIRAGFSKSLSVTMTAVAKAESSFRTAAVSYIGCCGGLWQINFTVHPVSKSDTFDPYINAQWAKKVYDSQGLSAWEAYTNGSYSQYVASAQAAVDRQWANGQAAHSTVRAAPSAGDGYVSLGWTKPPGTVTSYKVQRSTDGGTTWTDRGTPTTTTWTDSSVANGSTYRYRVRACNGGSCGQPSNVVEATIGEYDPDGDATVPGTPVGGSEGDDVDPDGTVEQCKEPPPSSNCGLSLLCAGKAALRWAFVPGQGTCEAWNGLKLAMQTKPPFSVVAGLSGLAIDFFEHVESQYQVARAEPYAQESLCADLGLDESGAGAEFSDKDEACLGAQLHQIADDTPLVPTLRWLAGFLVYIGGAFAMWRILKAAFTSSPDPEGVESSDKDDPDDR
jgi:hypothetical protein